MLLIEIGYYMYTKVLIPFLIHGLTLLYYSVMLLPYRLRMGICFGKWKFDIVPFH